MAAVRTTAELREGFQAFFEEKGHLRCPSASLIPRADDRSTLYTSAGMQPQMPYFLGREAPPAPLTTTCQKVFRTPDIDEVGLDTFHLTFFEMLGNFSFGQYFKEGAIEYATEFIQQRLKLDWDRVWVSVHAGDPELKLGPDEEAIGHWERIGMPPERIVPLPSSENFWSVGGPGPCGPDSEMYWDWGAEVGCAEGCLPGCTRCERFLEFGNLVFMSYELHADGTLTELPSKNIDTGWGLERVARVVQDVASVFDTDGYQLIMDWVAGQSGAAYGSSEDATKAHRVLADHGRGMTFIAAEGVAPSNLGRGYVLRRVVRRAVQHGLRIGLRSPFLPGLADVVIEQMGQAYPELVEHRDEIRRVLGAEEERFGLTLERGMAKFEEVAAKGELTAEDVFELQTTDGFPIELTEELARERGLAFNDEEYTRLMEEHREKSRGRHRELRAAIRRRAADGVRRLRADGRAHGDHGVRRPRRGLLPGQARRVAVLSGGRRPGHRRRLDREGRRLARRPRRRAAARATTRSSCFGAPGSRRATASAPSCRGTSAIRRWRTTRRRISSTRCCRRCSATTSARPARPCVPTSSASTSRIRPR